MAAAVAMLVLLSGDVVPMEEKTKDLVM